MRSGQDAARSGDRGRNPAVLQGALDGVGAAAIIDTIIARGVFVPRSIDSRFGEPSRTPGCQDRFVPRDSFGLPDLRFAELFTPKSGSARRTYINDHQDTASLFSR